MYLTREEKQFLIELIRTEIGTSAANYHRGYGKWLQLQDLLRRLEAPEYQAESLEDE